MGVDTSGNSRWIFLNYRDTAGTIQPILPGSGQFQIPYTGWSHVAIVKSGNVWTNYLNGTQIGQPVTATVTLPTNTGWAMNGNYRGSGYAFTGLLDEFRISNTALTPSQFLNAGSTSPQSGLDLHRPKLVVTDSSGSAITLQPAPGRNDGTDDGSANAGKDTGVFGQSSGGWPSHNFGKDSPVYVMTSTCNDSTGYAYLQFSLTGLPTQNIASAKVQVYMGSVVVPGLSPNSADPIFAVRRVTSSWDASKMTWTSGQPTYDTTVIDSQTLSGVAKNTAAVSGWLTFDITTLYKGWAGGSTPNYGLRFSHENG